MNKIKGFLFVTLLSSLRVNTELTLLQLIACGSVLFLGFFINYYIEGQDSQTTKDRVKKNSSIKNRSLFFGLEFEPNSEFAELGLKDSDGKRDLKKIYRIIAVIALVIFFIFALKNNYLAFSSTYFFLGIYFSMIVLNQKAQKLHLIYLFSALVVAGQIIVSPEWSGIMASFWLFFGFAYIISFDQLGISFFVSESKNSLQKLDLDWASTFKTSALMALGITVTQVFLTAVIESTPHLIEPNDRNNEVKMQMSEYQQETNSHMKTAKNLASLEKKIKKLLNDISPENSASSQDESNRTQAGGSEKSVNQQNNLESMNSKEENTLDPDPKSIFKNANEIKKQQSGNSNGTDIVKKGQKQTLAQTNQNEELLAEKKWLEVIEKCLPLFRLSLFLVIIFSILYFFSKQIRPSLTPQQIQRKRIQNFHRQLSLIFKELKQHPLDWELEVLKLFPVVESSLEIVHLQRDPSLPTFDFYLGLKNRGFQISDSYKIMMVLFSKVLYGQQRPSESEINDFRIATKDILRKLQIDL